MRKRTRRANRFEQLERRDLMTVTFSNASDEVPFVNRSWEFQGDGLHGTAWLDYDNDGYDDLFLANGRTQESSLFHNNGDGTFSDVTVKAGVGNSQGTAGVVAADIDNDGWTDLFLTGDGGVMHNVESPGVTLLHNNGDGTFADITESSGIVGPETAWSASMADVDADGYLDLFITAPGSLATKDRHTSKFFRNNGDLTFSDVTEASGVNAGRAACASGFSDYDIDGDVDLIVSNCNDVNLGRTPMQLFRNDGDFNFTDVSSASRMQSFTGYWMSTTMGDYDNDGDIDVFASNFGRSNARHGLFENQGDGTFKNVASSMGVANREFGWGASFADFDNDGNTDLFYAGSLPPAPFNTIGAGKGNPGRLFLNDPSVSGTFKDESANLGVNLSGLYTSGVAYSDYDRNGFPDLVVMASTWSPSSIGEVTLLQNDGNDNNWVGIDLVGTESNRDGVGARVTVNAAGSTQVQEVYAGSSFLSTDSKSLRFGLGQAEAVSSITVNWPNGVLETFAVEGVNQFVELVEGSGEVPQASSGDFNQDGQFDVADVDALVAEIVAGSNGADFDLTADTIVNRDDLDRWLIVASERNLTSGRAYPAGDANLDGRVDASDLNAMALRWRASASGWSQGDFTADGRIDARDLNELALNWRVDVTVAASRAPLGKMIGPRNFGVGLEAVDKGMNDAHFAEDRLTAANVDELFARRHKFSMMRRFV